MSEFSLHPQLVADTHFVTDLPLCRVLLINDNQYPWFVLVPRVASVSEAHHLKGKDRLQLIAESDDVCTAIERIFKPDKLNVAAIGNMVPQLHIHHIARYRDDVSWPGPVWGAHPAVPYTAEESEQRVKALKAQLSQ